MSIVAVKSTLALALWSVESGSCKAGETIVIGLASENGA